MEKRITEDEATRLLEKDIPAVSPGAPAPFVLTAEIDTTPQELRTMRSYIRATSDIPGFLPHSAQTVLRLLFDCFEKQGAAKEGLIGDILWGFAQSPCMLTPKGLEPAPPEFTFEGLRHLQRFGYIKFQAKDGEFIGPQSSKLESAWVKYEPKLLEMIYE
jgi:hypothetical protein